MFPPFDDKSFYRVNKGSALSMYFKEKYIQCKCLDEQFLEKLLIKKECSKNSLSWSVNYFYVAGFRVYIVLAYIASKFQLWITITYFNNTSQSFLQLLNYSKGTGISCWAQYNSNKWFNLQRRKFGWIKCQKPILKRQNYLK